MACQALFKILNTPFHKETPKSILLNFIDRTSLVWFPITSLLFRLPRPLSQIFRFIIPIANYVEFSYGKKEDTRAEAILDTFDMLSPSYDNPIKKSETLKWVSDSGIQVQRLEAKSNPGTMRFKKI